MMAKQDIYVTANDYGIEGNPKSFINAGPFPQVKGNPPIISAWKKTPQTRDKMLQGFFSARLSGVERWKRHIQSYPNFLLFNEHVHITYDESLKPGIGNREAYDTLRRGCLGFHFYDNSGTNKYFPEWDDVPDFPWERFVEPSPSVLRSLILESQLETSYRRPLKPNGYQYQSAFTERQSLIRRNVHNTSLQEHKLLNGLAKKNEISISTLIDTHLVKDGEFTIDADFLALMHAAKHTTTARTVNAATRVFEQSVDYDALSNEYEEERTQKKKRGSLDNRGKMYDSLTGRFFDYASQLDADVWHSLNQETRSSLGVMFYTYLYNSIEKDIFPTRRSVQERATCLIQPHLRKDILKAHIRTVHHRNTEQQEEEMLSIVESVPSEVFHEFMKI